MATQAQIDANRRNAQKSTGPRTEAGKAKSSRNGLVHGMAAEKHTFRGEDPAAFSFFVDRYHGHFQPVGPLEEDLVDCLASAMWRRRRFNAMEAGLVNLRLKLITPPERIQSDVETDPLPWAYHYDCTNNNSFSKLARYQGHQRREFESTLHELHKEQGVRIGKPKPGPAPAPPPPPTPKNDGANPISLSPAPGPELQTQQNSARTHNPPRHLPPEKMTERTQFPTPPHPVPSPQPPVPAGPQHPEPTTQYPQPTALLYLSKDPLHESGAPMRFGTRCGLVAVAVFAGAFGVSLVTSWAQSNQDSNRQNYAAKIRETYNFHFGPGKISTPGNADVEGHDFIQPQAFLSASYCGSCHKEAYSQWRQSLHSNAFRTPFYRTSVNILPRTKGIEFTRHCDSCHNPIAVLSGALTQNSQVDRSFDEDGVTCTTCHSIQQLQSTNGNGGFVMGIPSAMVDEDGNRIPGMVPDEEINKHPDRHSRAVMKDFYRTPEFCAACHKANLPDTLNDYKFIRAFTTYDEWQNSKFSQRNPLTFYSAGFTTCQDCHMQREKLKLEDYGAKHGTLSSHRWPAGNTAVPFYYGFDDQLQKTVEFLQSGMYLNVDLFAIKKAGQEGMTAPLGSTPFHLAPNEIVQMMVVIQNKNIGHSLVPEVRDLYEPWVEFLVQDAAGKEIYHSGFLKPDGSLDERAHSFTNRPVNMDGAFVENHKVWTIHSVAYDNTIQSGRSALVRYEFQIPAAAKVPLTVTARVNYRHLRQSYLNNIFGNGHPAYPVVELASRTRTLNIGDNPATPPDPHDNADWMRWNNLGIAYLDQLQYADSMHAFEQVVRLRPDYADGHINIGLTYIEWEKYSEARSSLERALELSPNNARALYYLALVERREGHRDEEVADLQRVVIQYPQARDPRRELGIAYYQRHQYDEAKEQFEALQKIDPDDLAAHYNLAVLYRRMGMKDKAAEQAAMFATKQVDPGAPTYSLEFLRAHPEISTESVPWHMHTDIPHTTAAGGGGQP